MIEEKEDGVEDSRQKEEEEPDIITMQYWRPTDYENNPEVLHALGLLYESFSLDASGPAKNKKSFKKWTLLISIRAQINTNLKLTQTWNTWDNKHKKFRLGFKWIFIQISIGPLHYQFF